MKLDLDQLRGKVAIVGAGPGDPELLTLRAHRLLARADVVLCDRLVNREILSACRDGVRIIDVGKTPGGQRTSQAVINHLLAKEARDDNFVVRLKGGDPFVFGRGSEEALHLREVGIDFEVVPGITSAIGVPERAGIPVTHRGVADHFSVVTGTVRQGANRAAWRSLATSGGTIVGMMCVRHLAQISSDLVAAGRDAATPAALIHRGTTDAEVTVDGTLADIAERAVEAAIASPAVLVVGDVVALRQSLCSGAIWEQPIFHTAS